MHKFLQSESSAARKLILIGLVAALVLGINVVAFAQPGVPSGSTRGLTVNQPPVVSVGVDQTIVQPDRAFLRGVVQDDTLTNPSAILYAGWSKISGPGTVVFGNNKDLLTWATFSATGTYVLRLTVNDGQLNSSDDITVTVIASPPHTLRVPQDYSTIQAAINAAQAGDLVLVSPGTYVERLSYGKSIILASLFYTTGNPSYIDQTIISSPSLSYPTILIGELAGPTSRIVGLSIRNGDDGIKIHGNVSVFNSKFTGMGADAIDYAGGSAGMVMDNYFTGNDDDAVDIDDADVLIEHNEMVANGEGVEIRASNHLAAQLTVIIRDNLISDNRKTGLQLIDIDTIANTAALLIIDRNVIFDNPQSGLSLMANKITTDDYSAPSLLERIRLFNNSFINNYYGMHGGDNVVAVNNLFVGHTGTAVKKVDGGSTLSYNLFWNNGTDNDGSNVVMGTSVFANPLLTVDYRLQSGSPAIDKGTASFVLTSGETALSIPPGGYNGTAPDIGRYESSFSSGPSATPGPSLTPTKTATPTKTSTPTNTATSTQTPLATQTKTATATAGIPGSPLYLSLTANQTLGGLASADEDILFYNGSTWSMIFDGSDVGAGAADLTGFAFLDADTLLMSFSSALTLNGVAVTPQDIVQFQASSLGGNTSGVFSMYLDGGDVGLDTTAENIDAISLLPDNRILISTAGSPALTGVSGARDEDVLAFSPTSLGDVTAGTWELYFDGSDVGLGETADEDIDALDITSDGNIYLSTRGIFSAAGGLSGEDEDVLICDPASLGATTSCTFAPGLYFDGSTLGLAANGVDAIHVQPAGSIPTVTPGPSATPTRTPTASATPSSADAIFSDGFESGGLTAWSSARADAGDLSVAPGAALLGSQGLRVVIDDTTAIYVTDDTPSAESHYRARFYFDPNSISMADGSTHYIFSGYMGTLVVLRVEFRLYSGNYQLRARQLDDTGTWRSTGWSIITDAAHPVELDWRAASSAGANDGSLAFWIDGLPKGSISNLDNDTRRIDFVRLGAVAALDSTTLGTYFLDAFVSRRQTYIGP